MRPNYGPEPSRAEAARLSIEYLKPLLKDPDSLKQFDIVSVRQMQYFNGAWESGFRVCFEYNAKNSYGAYSGLSYGGLIARCESPDKCVRYADGGRIETDRCLAR